MDEWWPHDRRIYIVEFIVTWECEGGAVREGVAGRKDGCGDIP